MSVHRRARTLSRRGHVEPFHVMQVVRQAALRRATHGDAILLCVGQPATSAPAPALRAATEALANDVLGYTETAGIRPLREAIADLYRRRHGLHVSPGDVLVTTGSSGGFQLALLAALDPGQTVAMTRPGYPAYRNTVEALGLRPIDLDCGHETRFQPTAAMLDALPTRPDAVVVASPANPTGTVIDPAELAAIARWCDETGCLLISDEIYHRIEFGDVATSSAWQTSRRAVVVGSTSKYFSMTGYRLGWLLADEPLRSRMDLLQGNLAICAPTISQVTAIGALSCDAQPELDAHVARYAANRDLLLRRLPELGITDFAPPDGAFYAYCDVSHLTSDSLAWCADLLARTGVALTPGVDFDRERGARTIRLSFCGTAAELDEGLDRLVSVL